MAPAPRVATLGYETAQTLLTLGISPLTATNLDGYAQWGGYPALPPQTLDAGLRTEPNLELLQQLKPDLILITEGEQSNRYLLEKIAPTLSFRLFPEDRPPLESSREAFLQLGEGLGRRTEAEAFVGGTARLISDIAREQSAAACKPAYLATLIDPAHLYVYGPDSLFGNVWSGMGRQNAWQGFTNRWGFAIVSPEMLASDSDARMLHIGHLGEERLQALRRQPLWQALPFLNDIHVIPPVLPFGGIASARRFAALARKFLEGSGR